MIAHCTSRITALCSISKSLLLSEDSLWVAYPVLSCSYLQALTFYFSLFTFAKSMSEAVYSFLFQAFVHCGLTETSLEMWTPDSQCWILTPSSNSQSPFGFYGIILGNTAHSDSFHVWCVRKCLYLPSAQVRFFVALHLLRCISTLQRIILDYSSVAVKKGCFKNWTWNKFCFVFSNSTYFQTEVDIQAVKVMVN